MADVSFVGALILAALIFVGEFFIFLALGKLWASEHFVAMGMFEIYPLIFAAIIGLYVFGHRYDETVKYYRYKRILKARKQSEVSHGQVEKFA
jgi:tetrahydromethanopterin S-methyltransferase subunit D